MLPAICISMNSVWYLSFLFFFCFVSGGKLWLYLGGLCCFVFCPVVSIDCSFFPGFSGFSLALSDFLSQT